MTAERIKRPRLDRDKPVRGWSTLFGPPQGRTSSSAPPPVDGTERASPDSREAPRADQTMSDTVEAGYRVVEDYLRQGQRFAQSFANPNASAGSNPVDDMQQMAQRLLQYGWDFAGLWFEMFTRLGGAPGQWPMSAAAQPAPPAAQAVSSETNNVEADITSTLEKIVVSVDSELPTTTSLELASGAKQPLIAHALRANDSESSAIKDVHVERDDSKTLHILVRIASDQPPGVYNGMLVDAETNLPRGTLSVRIADRG